MLEANLSLLSPHPPCGLLAFPLQVSFLDRPLFCLLRKTGKLDHVKLGMSFLLPGSLHWPGSLIKGSVTGVVSR